MPKIFGSRVGPEMSRRFSEASRKDVEEFPSIPKACRRYWICKVCLRGISGVQPLHFKV